MLKMMSLRKSGQKASRGLSRMVQRESKLAARATPLHPLLRLQQTVGNQGVGRLLQAKLKIGQPGDIYEQEADRVAEQVMRLPEPRTRVRTAAFSRTQLARIQRLCPECEEELRRQPVEEKEEEEETLQSKEVPGRTPKVTPDLESRIHALRGGGQPLPESVRAFFEPRFGSEFSQVRVHTDAPAAEIARAVNARAFTVGRDIVFGAEEYAPTTPHGQHLLAHELAHTIQQRVSRQTSAYRLAISQLSDSYGQEGDILNRNAFPNIPSEFIQKQATPGQRKGDCSGWESDPESFTKVIAEHYVIDALGLPRMSGNPTGCWADGKLCEVEFPGDMIVDISLAQVPHYVIARERGKNKLRCEYDYDCTPDGRVVFTRRSCRRS